MKEPDFFLEVAGLGKRVQKLWEERGFELECFPEITFRELKAFDLPFPGTAELIRHVSDSESVIPLDIEDSFGEPPVTLFRTERFVVDLYHWFTENTSIHSHGFRGAFRVLKGAALQAEYKVADLPKENWREPVIQAECQFLGVRVLKPGETVMIPASLNFIHEVGHCHSPQITLCIRTHDEKITQHRLIPPGFLFEDTRSMDFKTHKSLALITALARSGEKNKAKAEYRKWLGRLNDVTLLAHHENPGKTADSIHASTDLRKEVILTRFWGEAALSFMEAERNRQLDLSTLDDPLDRALGFLMKSGVNPRSMEKELQADFQLKGDINNAISNFMKQVINKGNSALILNETALHVLELGVSGKSLSEIENEFMGSYEGVEQEHLRSDIQTILQDFSEFPVLKSALPSALAESGISPAHSGISP